jgi:hypothetical protein
MKLLKPLLLLSIPALLLAACNEKDKSTEAPQTLIGSDSAKAGKTLQPEMYAAEMIANYHQNLTLEQYRAVKSWKLSVKQLEALIDMANKNEQQTVYFFPAANTIASVEDPANTDTEDDLKCTKLEDVPTLVVGVEDKDGNVTTPQMCVEFCPPPDICGDSTHLDVSLYDIPGISSMSLNQVVKYKFPKKIK